MRSYPAADFRARPPVRITEHTAGGGRRPMGTMGSEAALCDLSWLGGRSVDVLPKEMWQPCLFNQLIQMVGGGLHFRPHFDIGIPKYIPRK